ncbi:MAG TPA: hypothetical protein VMU93_04595 [Caulobacteraceae bacterium]|nr:hypothetical protein [Caulobacteraceae bacterium]
MRRPRDPNAASPPRRPDYSKEVLDEIAITLGATPPGEWAELALCPGPFGCPYATAEEAVAAGVEDHFCPGCRVIHLYRPA